MPYMLADTPLPSEELKNHTKEIFGKYFKEVVLK
jgi:hypothetical protein